MVAGTPHIQGYVSINIGGKIYLAHRIAFLFMEGSEPNKLVDHINGVRNDNRFINLRHASSSQNLANSKVFSHNTSGHRGVYLRKDTNRWQAQIKRGGRNIALGCYPTKEAASIARDKYAIEHFGDFYRNLNSEGVI